MIFDKRRLSYSFFVSLAKGSGKPGSITSVIVDIGCSLPFALHLMDAALCPFYQPWQLLLQLFERHSESAEFGVVPVEIVDGAIVVSHGGIDGAAYPVSLENAKNGCSHPLEMLSMIGSIEAQVVVQSVERLLQNTAGLNRFEEPIRQPCLR